MDWLQKAKLIFGSNLILKVTEMEVGNPKICQYFMEHEDIISKIQQNLLKYGFGKTFLKLWL